MHFKAVFSELLLNILLAVMKAMSSEWTKLFAKMQQCGTQSIRINQSSPTKMECSLIFNYPLLALSFIWEGDLWFAVLYSQNRNSLGVMVWVLIEWRVFPFHWSMSHDPIILHPDCLHVKLYSPVTKELSCYESNIYLVYLSLACSMGSSV